MASAVKFGPQLLQLLGIYNHPQILSLINSIHLNNNICYWMQLLSQIS